VTTTSAVWRKSGQVRRISGRRLQRQRDALFRREPLCRACARKGFSTMATIRDHILPLFEGGSDEDANVQPLCQDCSDIKTMAEALRARGAMARLGAACDAAGLPVNPGHPWSLDLREGGVKTPSPTRRKPIGTLGLQDAEMEGGGFGG
jgi:5-methylcytosine-specific restriction protein A